MDLLSDVLRDLRLESVVLSTGELRAPWGFDKGTVRGAAPFHVIAEGRGIVEAEVFDRGLRDLYRTAGSTGTFCYTFFKAVAHRRAS